MIAFNETKLRGMIAHAEDAMAVVKAGDESYSVITKPVRVREFELIIQLERELLAMLDARSVGLEAIQKWGVPRQLEKVREECLELALAITHYLDGRGDLDSMASEAADVENMIAQLRIIIGAPKPVLLHESRDELSGCESCMWTRQQKVTNPAPKGAFGV